MAGEWRTVHFGEVAEILPGKYIPAEKYDPTGQYLIFGSNSVMGKSRVPLYDGPIIAFARIGSNCGAAMYSAGPCWINNNAAGIRGRAGCCTRFLFYWMRNFDFARIREGSGQPYISNQTLEAQTVRLPPLAEQRAIAHILGTLDDKIELNRRMSETLEQMARALFKSWFVDFEPVRAKMEGRWRRGQSLPGLPAHLYDLFPARLVDSELGKIPEWWEVGKIADIGKIICGKTPPTREASYYGSEVPFITIPDIHGKIFVTETQKSLSYAGAASQLNKMLPPGSICVSCIATPGLVAMTSEPSQTNQQINTVIPANKEETFFWFWSLRNLGEVIRVYGSSGSVVTNLSTGRFSELQVLFSPRDLRCLYHSLMEPIFNKILLNERESRTLAALRDALLPKLIRGEIRVKDAERLVSQSVQNTKKED